MPPRCDKTDLRHQTLDGVTGWSGEGCIPALSPRACPLLGERSGRRSLLGERAAPPMLLVDQRLLSAQELGTPSDGGEVGLGEQWEREGWWNSCIRKDGQSSVPGQVHASTMEIGERPKIIVKSNQARLITSQRTETNVPETKQIVKNCLLLQQKITSCWTNDQPSTVFQKTKPHCL